jgi:hypothetical protein
VPCSIQFRTRTKHKCQVSTYLHGNLPKTQVFRDRTRRGSTAAWQSAVRYNGVRGLQPVLTEQHNIKERSVSQSALRTWSKWLSSSAVRIKMLSTWIYVSNHQKSKCAYELCFWEKCTLTVRFLDVARFPALTPSSTLVPNPRFQNIFPPHLCNEIN